MRSPVAVSASCAIISKVKPRKIWLPFYSCDSIRAGFEHFGVEHGFYAINGSFEPFLPPIGPGEMLLYINYFGAKDAISKDLAREFGPKLIIDNTQAFFSKPVLHSWSFYSARKFFGVADGAYLYSPDPMGDEFFESFPSAAAVSDEHIRLRSSGQQERAFAKYKEAEAKIGFLPQRISEDSRSVLKFNIDYGAIPRRRIENYSLYAGVFSKSNQIDLCLDSGAVPFCYPLILRQAPERAALANERLFLPQYWKECQDRIGDNFGYERWVSCELLPLPVDHRYDAVDCERVAHIIQNLANTRSSA